MRRILLQFHDENVAKVSYAARLRVDWHGGKFRAGHNILVPVSYTHLDVYKRQGLDSLGQRGAQAVGQKVKPLHGGSDVPARLGDGGLDFFGHSAAEELFVDAGGEGTAAPDGNTNAKHRADQLGQPGEKALLPAFHSGEGKDGQKMCIRDRLYGVEELSEQLGVTKSHLVRVFKQEIGVPPGKYLTSVRIEAVKALLLSDEYNLDMIAGLTGFSGANYLCRVFKREVGISPAAWRLSLIHISKTFQLCSP